ncbi:MAG: TonB-dependent receptor [Candidatus Eremiobacteraeota bacterium]|nr:TonB-dependent receptor [Candidatus Eremiobacteraeota bacterium]
MAIVRLRVAAVAFAFAALCPALPAFGAGGLYGTLNGTVVDAASKAPIAGAQVVARSASGKYAAKTDAKGFFVILGVGVDTYTVTITAPAYEIANVTGVMVFGDQTNAIGAVALRAALKTIAKVASRSVSSVYQPTQTTDSYTVNQQQMLQTQGKAVSTNENAVLLAVPGVTLTNNTDAIGSTVTIRGGAAAEVGYQFDGVPFKEPTEGDNGSSGLINGIGSVQVVEGAGDATQGGVGSGVINLIPEKGSGPGSGLIDLEAGGPNFSHQAGFSYGFSTPDDRFSEYVAYTGDRFAPYYGYSFTPLNQFGNEFASTYAVENQFLNNFIFRFASNQRIQILYANILQQGFQTTIGPGGIYNPATNPNALVYYPYDVLTQQQWISGLGYTPAQYARLVGLGPGVPTTNVAITTPQQNFSNQTGFLKLEYDNNLSPTTYLALRYYNWSELEYSDDQASLLAWGTNASVSDWIAEGGPTVGMNLDLVHQFGSRLTVTYNAQYNVLHPVYDDYEPQDELSALITGTGLNHQPVPSDWLPGGYLCGNNTNGPGKTGVDYLDCAQPGSVANARIPTWGINYNGSFFQNWGTGLRFQYDPTDKLKLDIGIREEGQNQHWFGQLDAYGQGVPPFGIGPNGNRIPTFGPFDVPGNEWQMLNPTALQPRASISWQLGRDTSLRFGYGRSTVFWNTLTAGTPFNLYGIEPYLNIPAKPGSTCGWTAAAIFPCRTFAQQLFWMGDNEEAPDVNTGLPASYTNYDFSVNHLFRNGWGMRVTPFFKEGTDLPANYLLNPVLGIFVTSNQGFNKTTGVEFGVTSPQRNLGISGFFTATYQNVLSTTPPFTTGETTVPLENLATLTLGDLYRAGYVSPFSIRIGAVDNLKNGITISPQIEYNVGYPYSVGEIIAACIEPTPTGCAKYGNVLQIDFGPGITGGQSSLVGDNPGSSVSTKYYDPSDPGTSLDPNIAATRGTPATAANGGILSHPNVTANLSVEWKVHDSTLGIQFMNLFSSAWANSVPAINPWYQPVANGISGPQTGYNSCVSQTGTARGCYPYVSRDSYAFTNGAYLLSNGNFTGTPTFGPIQPFNFQVYYQRAI